MIKTGLHACYTGVRVFYIEKEEALASSFLFDNITFSHDVIKERAREALFSSWSTVVYSFVV